jgi:hypothetical protein
MRDVVAQEALSKIHRQKAEGEEEGAPDQLVYIYSPDMYDHIGPDKRFMSYLPKMEKKKMYKNARSPVWGMWRDMIPESAA